jgi:very-short-patch-repair endonuclease
VRYDPERRDELRRRTRAEDLARLRRGVYLPPVDRSLAPAVRRHGEHLAHMTAVRARLTTTYWFSHTSAAVAWGCWTWRLGPEVHVTQLSRPAPGPADDVLRRHVCALPDADRVDLDGVPVTSLGRTVVDCARTLPEPSAIVVADSALALGVDPDELVERLDRSGGARGIRRARRVVGGADGASESPLESLVRWYLLVAGLPRFEHAHRVETWAGTFWIDLALPELRVGLEMDGAVKYDGRTGDPRQVFLAEKRRHDALVEAGWIILRVTFADLRDVRRLVARVEHAIRTARSR